VTVVGDVQAGPVPFDLDPMEARSEAELPSGAWQFEPKWDGFRCLAFKTEGRVSLVSKAGKPLSRYFPEMVAAFERLPAPAFVLDGELAVPVGESLDFDALLARVHPAASRIRKLSTETPAIFIAFDCLSADGKTSLLDAPLSERRSALERFIGALPRTQGVRMSPFTRDRAEALRWLDRAGGAIDGVVAKRLDGPYEAGERAMIKVKTFKSADCVVGGFRYARSEGKTDVVGSLLLGLFNPDGKLDHVGFTSGFAKQDRVSLTAELEARRGGPGFTGDAPGGPSRWATEESSVWEAVRPELVVEVQYDHTTGNRFRHGTRLLRFRPDKAPRTCTLDQLRQEARPSTLASLLQP
jgi:ATP-dependent DNA ligase